MILFSLIGEQPAPNLLPTRRLRPDLVVLAHTARTAPIAANLKALLEPECACRLCEVDPYEIPKIYNHLVRLVEGFSGQPLTFNLTGGTKPMMLAAYRLAQEHGSPFVYFQTEGNRSCLYRYAFAESSVTLEATEELPDTISLDDYLRAYLGTYETGEPRNDFEQQVCDALKATPGMAEVLTSVRPQNLAALEVDFIVRCGNQVGIGEVKTKGAKAGIDQITAVANQRYLGTYIAKFLVSAHPVDRNNRALAKAYNIEVIELPSFTETGQLSEQDRQNLTDAILRRLT
jgi:hypothetical protein